ncbi:hypothetical protein EJB05_52942, partial [Eragrostis curvula]
MDVKAEMLCMSQQPSDDGRKQAEVVVHGVGVVAAANEHDVDVLAAFLGSGRGQGGGHGNRREHEKKREQNDGSVSHAGLGCAPGLKRVDSLLSTRGVDFMRLYEFFLRCPRARSGHSKMSSHLFLLNFQKDELNCKYSLFVDGVSGLEKAVDFCARMGNMTADLTTRAVKADGCLEQETPHIKLSSSFNEWATSARTPGSLPPKETFPELEATHQTTEESHWLRFPPRQQVAASNNRTLNVLTPGTLPKVPISQPKPSSSSSKSSLPATPLTLDAAALPVAAAAAAAAASRGHLSTAALSTESPAAPSATGDVCCWGSFRRRICPFRKGTGRGSCLTTCCTAPPTDAPISTPAWPSLPPMSMTEETAAAGKGNSFPAPPPPRPAPKGTTGRSISKGIRLCAAMGGHGNCGGAWSRPVKPCARRSARSWPCRCTPSHASKEISMRGGVTTGAGRSSITDGDLGFANSNPMPERRAEVRGGGNGRERNGESRRKERSGGSGLVGVCDNNSGRGWSRRG